jgi:integrase
MRFTRQSVNALTIPDGKPYHIEWDEALPGFGVRVNPTGKVWVVQYRAAGKSRRETLGRVDTISLDVARETARKTLARVQLGADPLAEKAYAEALSRVTFEAVAARYLKHAQVRLKARSYEEVERHIKKHWSPLQGLPVHKIERALIATNLERIAEDSGPVASNRARSALSSLFAWAMGTGLVEANPVVGTIAAAQEVSRDHVISDVELAAIWNACRDDDHGRIVRLLILTGQRRDEVGGMKWQELDLANHLWTLPASRTKNSLAHEVPLPETAIAILLNTPKRERREYVFGEGKGGFSGWSKSKKLLDVRIAGAGAAIQPWRLHDLRRTVATRLGDLGVLPHVVEAILNHVSGHKAGVAGIYNRSLYRSEKRNALTLWDAHVQALHSTASPILG